ncbi:MAG: ABC transporter ATP-binding protein [Planctomycetota bacterium]|nr:ABC transporter ATP-binding protein [Planctomycetota bacterium]
MIRIEDLDFSYGRDGFRLTVPKLEVAAGEKVAWIGPSGSGKTTLLNLTAGIVSPDHGRIVVSGEELSALGDARRRDFRVRRIGMVFQEFELLDYLDVLDNILLPYRINDSLTLGPEVIERARALAEGVEIGDKLHRDVQKLSRGEQQRVALCRAVLTGPDVILADEPTGNLDPSNKERVLDILFRYADEHEATLVMVTHDRDLLPRFERVLDFDELCTPAPAPAQEARA